jgi:chromosomal replication initiation ATPase DnaA
MSYEKLITKILGEHSAHDGEVANRVLSYVAKNPDWENEGRQYKSQTMQAIGAATLELYNTPLSSYLKRSRKAGIVMVRAFLCKFLREETDLSLMQIGRLLNLHHATVIYNNRKVEDEMKIYPAIEKEYTTLKNCILSKL